MEALQPTIAVGAQVKADQGTYNHDINTNSNTLEANNNMINDNSLNTSLGSMVAELAEQNNSEPKHSTEVRNNLNKSPVSPGDQYSDGYKFFKSSEWKKNMRYLFGREEDPYNDKTQDYNEYEPPLVPLESSPAEETDWNRFLFGNPTSRRSFHVKKKTRRTPSLGVDGLSDRYGLFDDGLSIDTSTSTSSERDAQMLSPSSQTSDRSSDSRKSSHKRHSHSSKSSTSSESAGEPYMYGENFTTRSSTPSSISSDGSGAQVFNRNSNARVTVKRRPKSPKVPANGDMSAFLYGTTSHSPRNESSNPPSDRSDYSSSRSGWSSSRSEPLSPRSPGPVSPVDELGERLTELRKSMKNRPQSSSHIPGPRGVKSGSEQLTSPKSPVTEDNVFSSPNLPQASTARRGSSISISSTSSFNRNTPLRKSLPNRRPKTPTIVVEDTNKAIQDKNKTVGSNDGNVNENVDNKTGDVGERGTTARRSFRGRPKTGSKIPGPPTADLDKYLYGEGGSPLESLQKNSGNRRSLRGRSRSQVNSPRGMRCASPALSDATDNESLMNFELYEDEINISSSTIVDSNDERSPHERSDYSDNSPHHSDASVKKHRNTSKTHSSSNSPIAVQNSARESPNCKYKPIQSLLVFVKPT
ncbi:unnamed protein product [Owenia fusiformis]|uniref:Uncharacterized protein n=1 Tax=Owenia fusiformis TaxID=6347 RepID=A0A8J1U7A1_OWEFU|nr:unnamed protein product [Owenia fusiformis]